MKIIIVEDFEGYPDDTDASRRLFKEGEELEVGKDIPQAYADLIVAKGHAAGGAAAAAEKEHDHD